LISITKAREVQYPIHFFGPSFVVDLLMQHKFSFVNMFDKSW
jgi:hypothetical protein